MVAEFQKILFAVGIGGFLSAFLVWMVLAHFAGIMGRYVVFQTGLRCGAGWRCVSHGALCPLVSFVYEVPCAVVIPVCDGNRRTCKWALIGSF